VLNLQNNLPDHPGQKQDIMTALLEPNFLNTINWLLEPENPSVRFYTLTELLNKPADDPDVIASKQAIYATGVIPKILEKQQEDGFWGDRQKFYTEKYQGTVWQLMILAEMGANISQPQVRKACEFILENAQEPESGGFSYRKSAKSPGGLKNEIIPCLTGNMVWSLVKLGMAEDARVQKGMDWICNYQRADDNDEPAPKGWPYDRYEMCWGKHSCHMGVVKSLKALAAIPVAKRTEVIGQKIGELAEFILKHHIHKKSHNLLAVSRPGWLKFGFPLMYQTDVLEIAGILTSLGYHDMRMTEAIDVISGKQTAEGRWKLENTFNGRFITNIETKGKESKWITLKALKVMKNWVKLTKG
jgi:hypothetical protein